LIGGVIGSGIVYIMLSPSMNEIKESINDINDAIEAQAEQLESTNANLLSEILDIKKDMEILKNKKDFNIAFQEFQILFDNEITTDTLEIKGSYIKIDYAIYVKNEGIDEHYYNWARLHLYDKYDTLMFYLFLEGNEHFASGEHFFGILPLTVSPGEYYIKIDVNEKNEIRDYEICVWDYY